jgi:hypothetical protein
MTAPVVAGECRHLTDIAAFALGVDPDTYARIILANAQHGQTLNDVVPERLADEGAFRVRQLEDRIWLWSDPDLNVSLDALDVVIATTPRPAHTLTYPAPVIAVAHDSGVMNPSHVIPPSGKPTVTIEYLDQGRSPCEPVQSRWPASRGDRARAPWRCGRLEAGRSLRGSGGGANLEHVDGGLRDVEVSEQRG